MFMMQVLSSMSEERVQEEGEEVAEEVVGEGKHDEYVKTKNIRDSFILKYAWLI